MTTNLAEPYLKYALFCRDTETGSDDDLTFKGIIDLVELPAPAEPPGPDSPVLTFVDVNLAFCIARGRAGPPPPDGGDQGARHSPGYASAPEH